MRCSNLRVYPASAGLGLASISTTAFHYSASTTSAKKSFICAPSQIMPAGAEDESVLNTIEHDTPEDGQKQAKASPPTWQTEYTLICRNSIPLVGTYLLQYFYQLVIVLVASRLSTEELAGVSLGITTSNIVGYAIFEGMASALDTLCSQAYGANNPQLVGLHTIRYTIFIQIVAVPIGLLWVFSPQILGWIVPSQRLAENAGAFLRYSLIGVPGYATFEAGKRFMQAQNNFTAGLVVLLVCLPINLFLNWLLVLHLQLGIAGAALAAALTNSVRPFLLAAYAVCLSSDTLKCWPSSDQARLVFSNWAPMVRLAVPSALMTLNEWGAFEVITFSTSYVGTAQLAAQTFLATGTIVLWHIPYSVSIACSTRIGQLVGAGAVDAARRVAGWHMLLFVILGWLNAGLMLGLVQIIVNFLTIDETVRLAVVDAASSVSVFELFDTVVTGAHGIIRGVGWQAIGGWITVGISDCFGVPLAIGLELGGPNLGIKGLWIAMTIAAAMIAVTESLVIKVRSWDRLVDEAKARGSVIDSEVTPLLGAPHIDR